MPPAPPRGPSFDLRAWAARRQADLVLYLGAFLLSISALIFVSYQGSGLNGIAKSGLFAAYTVLFLLMGTQLRKWKRVQEAGPVFVALGAILTPLNFVALYTNVLHQEDIPQPWVWFAGSAMTSGLYFLLAKTGFGRFYMVPGALGALAAYASLGAVLELPAEWYGPWFLALAAVTNVVAHRQAARVRNLLEAGAYIFAIPGLAFSQLAVLGDGVDHAVLAVAYLFALAVVGRSAFPSRRAAFLAALPPFAVMTVASTAWSIPALREPTVDWAPAWILGIAAAYLVLPRIRPNLAEAWAAATLACGAAGIALAHLLVADGELTARLPVVYAMALMVAAAMYLDRRYPAAIGFVAPLAAAAAESALWSAGWLSFEWTSTFCAAAGFGFIALAWAMPKLRDTWYSLAAVAGALALAAAHIGATYPELNAWQLPVAYAMVAAGAAVTAWHIRPAALASVFAVATGGAATLWALEVTPAAWAFPALATGALIVATEYVWRRDAGLRELAWPAVVPLALTPILVLAPLFDEELFGAINFAAGAVLFFALALRSNGAFARLFESTSPAAARIERQVFTLAGSWMLFAALGFLNAAIGLDQLESAWTFAAAGVACWLAVAGGRKLVGSLEEVLGPVGLTAAVVAVLATSGQSGHAALMLSAFSASAVLAVGGRWVVGWRAAYLVAGALSLAFAHDFASDAGRDAWQLPLVYGVVLAALLWDSAWHRFQPAMVAVPAAATAFATTLGWWRDIPEVHFAWAPLGIAVAIAAGERLWLRGRLTRLAGWPWVLALSLVPYTLLGFYEDQAWYGALAMGAGAVLWAVTAWRSNGLISELLGSRAPTAALGERRALAVTAYGFGLATLAQFNYAAGIPADAAAWTFVAVGALALAAGILRDARVAPWDIPLLLAGITAFGVALATFPSAGESAGMLAIAGALLAAAGLNKRYDLRLLSGAGLLALALAFAWLEAGWQAWTLALAYAATATALFAGLAPLRTQPHALKAAVANLSTVPIVIAILTALAAAFVQWLEGIDDGTPKLVTTPEWLTLAATIAIAGGMMVFEGAYRLGRGWIVAGSAVLLLAFELTIARFEPVNVQAYTVPIALWLIGWALATRHSGEFFGRHMYAHELLFVLGAALLVGPPAAQSFEPGGSNWGLLVIAEGIALLGVGLTLLQRWLVVSGVLTLVGVAGRYFWDGSSSGQIPYWFTLGVIGLALLGVGVLMLLERDWWDRTRTRLAHWWLEGSDHHGSDHGLTPAA